MTKSWGWRASSKSARHSVRRMIYQSTQPTTAGLDLSIVLVDAVSAVSSGQLKWQNDRTGRVSWQPADLRLTGHCCPVSRDRPRGLPVTWGEEFWVAS